jgi:rare lipoprotein A
MIAMAVVLLGTVQVMAGGSTQIASNDHDRIGQASWYGSRYQGRTTASGEQFDMNALTAAHRRLPFGTHVRVTNLANKRSVVVRINDRGPYARGRLIDLSRRGAELLGFEHRGVARVRVEALLTRESIQSSLRQSRNFDPIKLRPPRTTRRR